MCCQPGQARMEKYFPYQHFSRRANCLVIELETPAPACPDSPSRADSPSHSADCPSEYSPRHFSAFRHQQTLFFDFLTTAAQSSLLTKDPNGDTGCFLFLGFFSTLRGNYILSCLLYRVVQSLLTFSAPALFKRALQPLPPLLSMLAQAHQVS